MKIIVIRYLPVSERDFGAKYPFSKSVVFLLAISDTPTRATEQEVTR